MQPKQDEKELFLKAQKRVKQIKIFYWHLALYLIVMALILLNFYVMEEGPYVKPITGLNVSIIVLWSIAIIVNAIVVFRRKPIFNKDWEEKKIEEYLKDKHQEEQTFWE